MAGHVASAVRKQRDEGMDAGHSSISLNLSRNTFIHVPEVCFLGDSRNINQYQLVYSQYPGGGSQRVRNSRTASAVW